jgi:hypothetical protein
MDHNLTEDLYKEKQAYLLVVTSKRKTHHHVKIFFLDIVFILSINETSSHHPYHLIREGLYMQFKVLTSLYFISGCHGLSAHPSMQTHLTRLDYNHP